MQFIARLLHLQVIECADDKVALDQETRKILEKAKQEAMAIPVIVQMKDAEETSADKYLVKRLNKRITDLEHQVMDQEEELAKFKRHSSPNRRVSSIRPPPTQPAINGAVKGAAPSTGTKKVIKIKKNVTKNAK